MSDDARAEIMTRLRRSLGRTDAVAAERTVAEHLAQPESIIPARGDLDLAGRIALFISQAEAVQTSVRRVEGEAQIAAAVVDYLRANNLPMRLVMAKDPMLERAEWPDMIEIRRGRADDADPTGLTTAFAGIAETGTLMLLSDADHPTTIAFLPETSIVAVRSHRVLRAYEDALRIAREERRGLPRSINFITGPSRSGDIEQTIQLGAHGPKRLLVLLVDRPGTEQTA